MIAAKNPLELMSKDRRDKKKIKNRYKVTQVTGTEAKGMKGETRQTLPGPPPAFLPAICC
jgi:hypothetical protein